MTTTSTPIRTKVAYLRPGHRIEHNGATVTVAYTPKRISSRRYTVTVTDTRGYADTFGVLASDVLLRQP